MTWEAWFKDLLPTKWSRRVAFATIVIAGAAFGVPSVLPQSYLPESQEKIFLLKIILLLLVAFVGTLAVLILVVREFNVQAREIGGAVTGNEPEVQLSETHQRVLRLLFEEPRTVEEIHQSVGANREEVNHYLHDLLERGMVHHPTPYAPGPERWRISQQGRQFIMQEDEP